MNQLHNAILPIKRGQLSSSAKAKLHNAGVIVLEVDSPKDIKLISSAEIVNGNKLLHAALQALRAQPQPDGQQTTTATRQREEFVNLFTKIIEASVS